MRCVADEELVFAFTGSPRTFSPFLANTDLHGLFWRMILLKSGPSKQGAQFTPATMARGRGRLREDDDDNETAPQLPPSAVVPPRHAIPNNDEDEERLKQRELDELLGEYDSAPVSEPSDAEELFDEDLMQKYVVPVTKIYSMAFSIY